MIEGKKLREVFSDIKFIEKSHKYYVRETPIKKSVSGLIGDYKPHVPWESIIKNVALKEHTTPKEIKDRWARNAKEACDKGNSAHDFGEEYMFDRSLKPKTGQQKAIVKFWNDLPSFIVPVVPELKMYHFQFMFAGTADIILYNKKTDKYIIGDYKTNKDLFKQHKDTRMEIPFSMGENPFNHYQLQLSYYQILLEQVKGVEVSHRKIIWLQDDGNYKLYDTDNFTDTLREELILYRAA